MNYQDVSIKKLASLNKDLFDKVYKKYKYDCVIFIAKGSYLIGKGLADFVDVPLLEIYATRKGGKLKKLLRPILTIMPEKLKIVLRKREMNSDVHSKNSDRDVSYEKEVWSKYLKCKKILIVDDSIDTGYSALLVKEAVEDFFKNAQVKVASLNYFTKAKKVFVPDFYLFKDTMLKGPWSNDSKENKKFIKLYNNWKED